MATDGTGFLSGMNFVVTDVPNGGAAVGGAVSVAGSGGFAMSKDEMESLLTKAEGTRKLIRQQMTDARDIAMSEPPGHDQASINFTNGPNGANDVGKHYLGHLEIQYNRYTALIQKLDLALGKTFEADQQASTDIKTTGEAG